VGDKDGNTQLHFAAKAGNVALFKELSASDNVNSKNKDGNTALHIAFLNGMDEAGAELLRIGADSHIKNNEGQTPLDLIREK
jgi:ankyrin repeat protein